MNILGVDFGERKIGISIATSSIAEPYSVVKIKNINSGVLSVALIVEKEKVDRVVVGISEGSSAEKSIAFGEQLEDKTKKEVVFQDETLSTKEAQKLSIQAGIKRKKRKDLEDAYAATVILQEYLDSKQ